MTPQRLIEEVQNHSKEWLEMHPNPDAMVSGILALKVIKLMEYIEYLERRNKHDNNIR